MSMLEFRRDVVWDEPRGRGRGWRQGPDDSSKAAWGWQPPCSGVPFGVPAGGTAQEVGPFLSRGGGRRRRVGARCHTVLQRCSVTCVHRYNSSTPPHDTGWTLLKILMRGRTELLSLQRVPWWGKTSRWRYFKSTASRVTGSLALDVAPSHAALNGWVSNLLDPRAST